MPLHGRSPDPVRQADGLHRRDGGEARSPRAFRIWVCAVIRARVGSCNQSSGPLGDTARSMSKDEST